MQKAPLRGGSVAKGVALACAAVAFGCVHGERAWDASCDAALARIAERGAGASANRSGSGARFLDWQALRNPILAFPDRAQRNIDGALARHGHRSVLGWKRDQSFVVAESKAASWPTGARTMAISTSSTLARRITIASRGGGTARSGLRARATSFIGASRVRAISERADPRPIGARGASLRVPGAVRTVPVTIGRSSNSPRRA